MSDPLIDELSRDLRAVKAPLPPTVVALLWLVASVTYVAALMVALGPFRPGFVDQLAAVPRFAIEMLMGFAALVCFVIVAFREAVPGYDSRLVTRVGWLLSVGWLSQFVAGFEFPVLEPSMLGKRHYCAYEAYLYSVPPALYAIWLQRRRFALQPVRASVFAAIAAGMIPALLMQVASRCF